MAARPERGGAVHHQHRLGDPSRARRPPSPSSASRPPRRRVTPILVAALLFASADDARVLAVAAAGVRQLLARFLAGAGEPVTHVLVADPSYGAT